ncbi:Uncharacterised protein [Mycobacteroides abscessus subsp. abscessus]|nr:Uncharacterised protein [Mycobacteroides abscessus subsp. abscessus]
MVDIDISSESAASSASLRRSSSMSRNPRGPTRRSAAPFHESISAPPTRTSRISVAPVPGCARTEYAVPSGVVAVINTQSVSQPTSETVPNERREPSVALFDQSDSVS